MSKLEDLIEKAMSKMLSDDELEFDDRVEVLNLAIKWAAHLSRKGMKGKFGEGLDDDED